MSARKVFDWSTALAYVLCVLFFAAIVVVVFLIRLWIAGGDFECVFAQDPALCVAVKGVR